MSAYYENLDGLSERTKYRFRFYGNFSQNINGKFERKIKSNDVNYKISESKNISLENIYKSKFPKNLNLSPNIDSKYQRYYFYNRLKNIRCTVDVGLQVINVKISLSSDLVILLLSLNVTKK